jgi:type IV secretion system protein TrbL
MRSAWELPIWAFENLLSRVMPFSLHARQVAKAAVIAALFVSLSAYAQTSAGVLDDVTDRFQAAASKWSGAISKAATFLFWSLALISLVWTFGMRALQKADLAELFVDLFKFVVFTGLFYWLINNAPAISTAIINSLKQLAGEAAGVSGLTPSGIVEVGFKVFDKVIAASSVMDLSASIVGLIMGIFVLCLLALVAINMVVLLVSAWIVAYAGIFFLGFGGARFTQDIAVNYLKTVLGVAGALMGMTLLVGIGQEFINSYFDKIATVSLREMGAMLVASLALLLLSNKIPPLIGGIASGGSIGAAAGMGSAGAGSLLATGAMGAAAAAAAVGAAMSAATSAAGMGSAVSAAISASGATGGAGDTGISSMPGGAQGGGAGKSATESSSTTPLGAAMGDAGAGHSPGANVAGDEQPAGGGETEEEEGGAPDSNEASTASEDQATGGPAGEPGKQRSRSALGALGSGIAAVARSSAGIAVDAARERVSQTAGGRVAAEIRSPGTAQSRRSDMAAITRSQSIAGKAQGARNFLNAGAAAPGSSPSFSGDSLAGFSNDEKSVDAEAEISAFANQK